MGERRGRLWEALSTISGNQWERVRESADENRRVNILFEEQKCIKKRGRWRTRRGLSVVK